MPRSAATGRATGEALLVAVPSPAYAGPRCVPDLAGLNGTRAEQAQGLVLCWQTATATAGEVWETEPVLDRHGEATRHPLDHAEECRDWTCDG